MVDNTPVSTDNECNEMSHETKRSRPMEQYSTDTLVQTALRLGELIKEGDKNASEEYRKVVLELIGRGEADKLSAAMQA